MERLLNKDILIGDNCKIAPTVVFLKPEREQEDSKISIGSNVTIRDGSIIYGGVTIGNDVTIDHYCIIREGVIIGNGTRLNNFTEINRDVKIGKKCRIAGMLANRVEIGDSTSSFGYILHKYPNHGEGKFEDSPRIGNEVVIGRLAVVAGNVKITDRKRIKAGQIISENKS